MGPRLRPRLVQRQAPISLLSLIPSKATQNTEEVESGTNDKENGDGGDRRLTRADTDHDVAQTRVDLARHSERAAQVKR